MAVTKTGASSPSPEDVAFANPKGKVSKKAIAFKSKLGFGVLKMVRGSNPRVLKSEPSGRPRVNKSL